MKAMTIPFPFSPRLVFMTGALGVLAGCGLIDPFYDEKGVILSSLPEPSWSYVTEVSECPADRTILRGVALAPDLERKLRGVAFVVDRASIEAGAPDLHWIPHLDFDLDGDLLANRYFAELQSCEFGELAEAKPDKEPVCFGAYCPCEGDRLAAADGQEA